MSVSGLSQSSFKAPSQASRRFFLSREGRDIPLNYYYKFINTDGNVKIDTPQELKTYVSSDKTVHFRFMQINDPQFQQTDGSQYSNLIRMSVVNQRNTYDFSGLQTQIVGYMTYNDQNKMMQGETLAFEVDSRDIVVLTLEKLVIASNTWIPYVISTPTTTKIPYIQIDCEIQFDYNNL